MTCFHIFGSTQLAQSNSGLCQTFKRKEKANHEINQQQNRSDYLTGELLEENSALPAQEVIHSCIASDLDDIMSELTLQGREVLILSFGLKDGQELTLGRIGSRLNRSQERIRLIRNKSQNPTASALFIYSQISSVVNQLSSLVINQKKKLE